MVPLCSPTEIPNSLSNLGFLTFCLPGESIEVQRAYFASAQQRMLDIIRERETLLESMPSGWFIRNRMKIEYEVISSEKTQEVLRTRREDDVELFS